MKTLSISMLYLFLVVFGAVAPANADLKVGQKAKLFQSVDENLQHVDMAKLVDGRPLVLVVGSCS